MVLAEFGIVTLSWSVASMPQDMKSPSDRSAVPRQLESGQGARVLERIQIAISRLSEFFRSKVWPSAQTLLVPVCIPLHTDMLACSKSGRKLYAFEKSVLWMAILINPTHANLLQKVHTVTHGVVVSTELAKLFSILSNPNRIRIVEELRQGELSVNELQDLLGITHAAVSQQLAVLRTNRIVVERREGRNVFYHLKNPQLAAWVLAGVKFISPDNQEMQDMIAAIEKAKETWT